MSIREEIEKREQMTLIPEARCACRSLGRLEPEEPDEIRTCFMVDRDRVVHSKAFRRLRQKTQVFIAPFGDHYRTRLTHTLEVHQVAQTIGAALNLNVNLIEAIALAHDVGHPPFSHAGELFFNQILKEGFKHSAYGVRVLSRLEMHHGRPGLNLSREVLDGVLHHSGYGTDAPKASTLEGQVVRISDKIAYVNHDIDDAVRAGILQEEEIPSACTQVLGDTNGKRIASLVTDTVRYTRQQLEQGVRDVSLSPQMDQALFHLRAFMFENVYLSEVCMEEKRRASFMMEKIYDYYIRYPEKLNPFYQTIADQEGVQRAVVDYIAGMTDDYCIDTFQQLYIPCSRVSAHLYKK